MNTTKTEVRRDDTLWEVEVKAELAADVLESYRAKVLAELQKSAKIDGFRPGKAPIDAVRNMYGEESIMRRAAEMAIQHELPDILAHEKILVIEAPHVTTDVPIAGKSLVFTAKAPLAPQIRLGDYRIIAEKHRAITEDVNASDQDIADATLHIRRERARIDRIESGINPQQAAEESRTIAEKDLPELDDVFAQSIGYADATVFAEALRTNIKHEKERRAFEKRRSIILEEIVKESQISYPARLREYELNDMEAQIKDDLARAGATFDGYLAEIKKTREELRDTWTDAADMRVKVRLVLAEIARIENIEPPADVLDHEIQHAHKQYPSADLHVLRAHITHAMRNEATLRWLEDNHEKTDHTTKKLE
jgi:FKBP-type peptidyl-prolyl cis-trans isomerase (trigger factor)